MTWKPLASRITFFAAAFFLVSAPPLRADIVEWVLQSPLTFGMGGNLTGSFDYDASTNTYSNLNLTMTSDGVFSGFGPADIFEPPWAPLPFPSGPSALVIGLSNQAGPVDVGLKFANPLTNNGGTDTVASGIIIDVRELILPGEGLGDDESVNTPEITATPEPAYSMLVLGVMTLLFALRHGRLSSATRVRRAPNRG